MKEYSAKIIADSISNGIRLTTFELCYPRFIHSEFMTHRSFSRNASSSRAIPVKKMIAQVYNNPAMPIYWGANISGMQAKTQLPPIKNALAIALWLCASKAACIFAYALSTLGSHKQITNRILEPWQWMNVIVTATDFDNFFNLRCHPDAQPEIQKIAQMMEYELIANTPTPIDKGWHLPYITPEEKAIHSNAILVKLSTARCARVSYLTHDGANPSITKDIELYCRLVGSEPLHASPSEHQATPLEFKQTRSYDKNFRGWKQHRSFIETKTPIE